METFKILLIGDSGTGKSSLLLRFTDDSFFGEEMAATIGVDFKVKYVPIEDDKCVKLTIWDTAGQERFRTLTSSYYRGAHGIILVYDVCRRDTFTHLAEIWDPELKIYTKDNVVRMIVGNKIDQEGREVDIEEGRELAKEMGALFMEASAKTKLGVQQAFEEITRKILERPELWKNLDGEGNVKVNDSNDNGDLCAC